MNNLSCIFNYCTLYESIIIGFITLIIGTIIFNLTSNEKNKKNIEKQKYLINITFFMTGFLLHFIVEIIGLNKWYCNGKCPC